MASKVVGFLSFIILLTPILAFSQSFFGTFEGTVLETHDAPLAYVSVGVVNKSIGTVSNNNGHFMLEMNKISIQDTIRLSLVGYTSLEFPVSDLLNNKKNNIFYLSKHKIIIDEVNITGKQRSHLEIGRKANSGLLQATFNPSKTEVKEKLGTEIGMKMKYSEKSTAIIKDFNCYFSSNNFDYLKFRLNIYSLKNDLPDSLISNKNIIVEIPDAKTGWIKVDLLPYNINISTDFMISLQWLDSRFTQDDLPKIWIPGTITPFNDIFQRDASQDKWRKSKAKISYYTTLLY